MPFQELYSLTPRSFFNAVNGTRKKEDAFSKERWVMTREIMFAAMMPYLEKGTEKTDVITFDWEQKEIKRLAEQKSKTIVEDIEQIKEFWERQDNASQPEKE
jgi:hypothetical protein